MTGQLLDVRAAFDSAAADYDVQADQNAVLDWIRQATRSALLERVAPGARLLDLGCGTGMDAVFFAERGYHVTAIDWSPEMIARAQARRDRTAARASIEIRLLGIHESWRFLDGMYDAAYSNLGALNCAPDLTDAMVQVCGRLRTKGWLIASIIGRLCPWEIALYIARGDWRRAFVRWRRGPVPVPLNGRTVWTRYYLPSEASRALAAAGLCVRSLRALGTFSPPPYLDAFAKRRARLVERLLRLDERTGGWPLLRQTGDHFLVAAHRGA